MTREFNNLVEDFFHILWKQINEAEQPDATFPTTYAYQLFDTKTHAIDNGVTGKAQSARCIYCNKTITSWGMNKRLQAKKNKRWPPSGGDIGELRDAYANHTIACAETWAWATLSRWAIKQCRSEGELAAIDCWVKDIAKRAGDVERYNAGRESAYGREVLFVVRMLKRLPSPDSAIWQAVELFIEGMRFWMREWIEGDTLVSTHGETEDNPHVFLPTQLGDAEYGKWGMCPCGKIETRFDLGPHDRLIEVNGRVRVAEMRIDRIGMDFVLP